MLGSKIGVVYFLLLGLQTNFCCPRAVSASLVVRTARSCPTFCQRIQVTPQSEHSPGLSIMHRHAISAIGLGVTLLRNRDVCRCHFSFLPLISIATCSKSG